VGTKWKAGSYGKWAGFVGHFVDTTAYMLGYRGPVTRAAAIRFAVRHMRIPARFWKPVAKGVNWHGFRSYETYQVTYRGMTLVGSLLRHSDGIHTYLVFVLAPTRTFIRERLAFKRFAKSFIALGAAKMPRGWKRWTSKAWKISMLIPAATRWKAASFGRWGGFAGFYGRTRIVMLGYRGPVTLAAVRRFVVLRTGIPARFWRPVSKGVEWNGFRYYETYRVSHRGKTLVGAVLRHRDRRHTYVVFVHAPTRNFILYRKAYKLFGNSFIAL
jgi:hypothetical protein